jgi:hypothetical protein
LLSDLLSDFDDSLLPDSLFAESLLVAPDFADSDLDDSLLEEVESLFEESEPEESDFASDLPFDPLPDGVFPPLP